MPDYTGELLAAGNEGQGRRSFVAPLPASTSGRPLVEPLSERELDVLRLLRSDPTRPHFTGPDIARELVVALSTLRTHTKSIYSKLDVNSRRAAVKRAGELGLI